MLLYVDGSAALRFLRRGSSPVAPIAGADLISSSELIEIELRRAFEHLWLVKQLSSDELERRLDDVEALLARFHLFPVADDMLAFARPRMPLELGVMASVHVATAQVVQRDAGEPVQFWTHVAATGSAAASRGLDVRGLAAPA